jgi:hypothetical protein
MAEWLRRWPAKPMCNACVGSNPTSVAKRPVGTTFAFAFILSTTFFLLPLVLTVFCACHPFIEITVRVRVILKCVRRKGSFACFIPTLIT